MFKRLLILGLILGMVGSAGAQNEERDQLVLGNITFAFHLYDALVEENPNRNLIFSPYSISQAFAMAYAGARGNTQTEMQAVFDFRLSQERLPLGFQDLTASFAPDAPAQGEQIPFQLTIANALWGQADFGFNLDYLTLMNETYGAKFELMEFASQPEESRQEINDWVSESTEGKIQDFLPADSISPQTRLLLTNAVHFKAGWFSPFEVEDTQDRNFTLVDGSLVRVPLMSKIMTLPYFEGKNYQVLSLGYVINLEMPIMIEMMIILPQLGEFEAVQSTFSPDMYAEILDGLALQSAELKLPRFESEFSTSLSTPLKSLGLVDAFDPDLANFRGMLIADTMNELFISEAIHMAFVKVDEAGTEATAATALYGFEPLSGYYPPEPTIEFYADRPFIYLIYDRESGSILFLGRVMNPTE